MKYDKAAWERARAKAARANSAGPLVAYATRETPSSGTVKVPLKKGQSCTWEGIGNDILPVITEE